MEFEGIIRCIYTVPLKTEKIIVICLKTVRRENKPYLFNRVELLNGYASGYMANNWFDPLLFGQN